MKDYFDHPEEIPENVKEILEGLEKEPLEYSDLARITTELNKIGWTMDYGLDAVPFDLQPLNT